MRPLGSSVRTATAGDADDGWLFVPKFLGNSWARVEGSPSFLENVGSKDCTQQPLLEPSQLPPTCRQQVLMPPSYGNCHYRDRDLKNGSLLEGRS